MIRRLNPLMSLTLLAVILHGALLFVVIPVVSARVTPLYNHDRFADGYDQLALNLLQGNGYRFYPDTARTLMREPGYPIFLAGLFFLFGNTFLAVKLANMCLALATAWLMIRLAGHISSNRVLLIAPPLLFLFHPATLIAESRGGVEILFTFLITGFMLALYTALERETAWHYAIAGTVLGLTVLVRSTPLLFPFFLLGYMLLMERKRVPILGTFKNIAMIMVAMVVVLSPWIIRNYAITRQFVPTSSVVGVSAHAGQYICTHLSEGKPWWLLDREAARERDRLAAGLGYPFKEGNEGYYQTFYKSEDEIKFSKYLMGRVIDEYRSFPAMFVKCLSFNLFNFWFAGKTQLSTLANVVVQLPYLVLAVAGAMLGLRSKQWRCRMIGPMVLFIGYVMAVHAPILAQARYGVPLIPLLSLLASITLVAMQGRIRRANGASIMSGGNGSAELTSVGEPVLQGSEKQ
jgi:4-amino-4-deoxy-L-arabinose transferase-like glycosyltransferase